MAKNDKKNTEACIENASRTGVNKMSLISILIMVVSIFNSKNN